MDVDQEFLHFHEHLDIPDKRKMTSKSIYMFAEFILILYFRSGSRNSGGWLGIRIRLQKDSFHTGILCETDGSSGHYFVIVIVAIPFRCNQTELAIFYNGYGNNSI